jgi:ParB/RepB/Spo0J family partition protein
MILPPEKRDLRRLRRSVLHLDPSNPRSKIDVATLMPLAESLKHFGQQVPGLCYPSADHPGEWKLLDGHRRWHALGIAGIDEMDVVVLAEKPDPTDQLLIQLSLGVTGERLTPYQVVDGYRAVKKQRGVTQEAFAEMIGSSQSWVSKAVRVADDLAPELRESVESGAIPSTIAATIARLKDNFPAQIDIVSKVKEGLLNRDGVTAAVNKALGAGKDKAKKPVKARTAKGLRLELPQLDPEALIAELMAVVEALRKLAKSGFALTNLQQLLKQSAQ